MVLRPGSEAEAQRIFEKWELDFALIGHVTDSGRLVLRMHGKVAADIPVGPLVTEAPLYERPWRRTPPQHDIDPGALPDRNPLECLRQLIASPALASKRWIWEQYDHLVMGNTVKRPGGDAAVIRVGATKALAMATDCTPRYCRADPVRGGMQAVAENWRNLTAVGALPLALTDNLNFGNPERPEIMGQIVGAIEGMREACLALDYPVVSGNVSLYNETSGSAILPTPVIGGVGVIAELQPCRRPRSQMRWRQLDPDWRDKRSSRRLALLARDRGERGRLTPTGRSDSRAPQRRFCSRRDHGRAARRVS